jgi:2,4-dienoyl-CoA reductase-like NADH-dependent reductase (Old Yellow Enzyme family)
MDSGLSRRDLLKASGVALAGAALLPAAGCRTGGPAVTSDTACLEDIPQREVSIDIFEPVPIGKVRLKNRIIRSATTISDIDAQGLPRSGLMKTYGELAAGGVGCVITGMKDGGMLLNDFRYRDEDVSRFREVPELFHRYDVPVLQQLSHEGRQEKLGNPSGFSVTKLTPGQIDGLIDRFADATEKCRRLGFDGVQMHCAHGYLLSEFLNPALNGRADKWGGSTENRFRAVGEVFQRARKRVGPDFALWAKINAYDFQDGGMRIEEAVKIAGLLEEAGCDCVEISSGIAADGFATIRVRELPTEAILEWSDMTKGRGALTKKTVSWILPLLVKTYAPLANFNVCQARQVKESVDIPVIVVGGIRNREDIQDVFRLEAADCVSLGRPLLTEPDFVNKLKADPAHRSACIDCGYCILALTARPAECFMGSLPS